MDHFGKWIYDPKKKALTHSESGWERFLRNFAHFSDADDLIIAVADRQQDLFD